MVCLGNIPTNILHKGEEEKEEEEEESMTTPWNFTLFTFRACAINIVSLVAKVNIEGHRTWRAKSFFDCTSVSTRGTSLNRNTFYFTRMRNTTVTLVANSPQL